MSSCRISTRCDDSISKIKIAHVGQVGEDVRVRVSVGVRVGVVECQLKERSLATQKLAGSNLVRSAYR